MGVGHDVTIEEEVWVQWSTMVHRAILNNSLVKANYIRCCLDGTLFWWCWRNSNLVLHPLEDAGKRVICFMSAGPIQWSSNSGLDNSILSIRWQDGIHPKPPKQHCSQTYRMRFPDISEPSSFVIFLATKIPIAQAWKSSVFNVTLVKLIND